MRIGMLSKFPPEKCGIAIYTQNLAEKLKCDVVKIGTNESDADYHIDLKSFCLGKKLKEIIEKEKIDLLHVQHIPPYYSKLLNLNLIMAMKQKIPIVVTLHEVHSPANLRDTMLSWIEKQLAKKATGAIVHTPAQAEYLKRHYNANARNILMGINPKKENKGKKKNILFFGMINSNKGVDLAVEAMKQLKDYKLRVAGKVVEEGYDKKLQRTAGKNVTLNLGWASEKDKEKYFREASITVLPYRWGPYQSAIIPDAAAYGMPVVATRTGAIHEMAEKFGFGEIVKPEATAIAEGIKKVYESYAKYKKGIQKYRKEADWKNVAKETEKFYEELLTR